MSVSWAVRTAYSDALHRIGGEEMREVSGAGETPSAPGHGGAQRDWTKRKLHDPSFWRWAQRARVAASLFQEPDRYWVCDIGCGMQHLKWFLPRGAVYLPADVQAWSPDTEICDLDKDDLPVRSLAVCDVAALLGVISYLKEPERALRGIAGFAEHIVLSYRTIELTPVRKSYWTNAYSLTELVGVLGRSGFEVTDLRTFKGQVVVRAANKSFGPGQAARREAARAAYPKTRQPSFADAVRRLYFNVRTHRAITADLGSEAKLS